MAIIGVTNQESNPVFEIVSTSGKEKLVLSEDGVVSRVSFGGTCLEKVGTAQTWGTFKYLVECWEKKMRAEGE